MITATGMAKGTEHFGRNLKNEMIDYVSVSPLSKRGGKEGWFSDDIQGARLRLCLVPVHAVLWPLFTLCSGRTNSLSSQYYRRFPKVAGKPSFSTLYTSINVLAGH